MMIHLNIKWNLGTHQLNESLLHDILLLIILPSPSIQRIIVKSIWELSSGSVIVCEGSVVGKLLVFNPEFENTAGKQNGNDIIIEGIGDSVESLDKDIAFCEFSEEVISLQCSQIDVLDFKILEIISFAGIFVFVDLVVWDGIVALFRVYSMN